MKFRLSRHSPSYKLNIDVISLCSSIYEFSSLRGAIELTDFFSASRMEKPNDWWLGLYATTMLLEFFFFPQHPMNRRQRPATTWTSMNDFDWSSHINVRFRCADPIYCARTIAIWDGWLILDLRLHHDRYWYRVRLVFRCKNRYRLGRSLWLESTSIRSRCSLAIPGTLVILLTVDDIKTRHFDLDPRTIFLACQPFPSTE